MDINIKELSDQMKKMDGFEEPGKEPYKLLALLSMSINNSIVFDVGTYRGKSAKALAYNKNNRVISYDRVNSDPDKVENITYEIGDFRKDPQILNSPLISIDTDPHDGVQEREFHKFFLDNNYKGIVVWDDISLHNMKSFWDEITQTKYDLTSIGHHSGTGLVIYG